MIITVLLNGLWQGVLIVAIATLIGLAVPRRHAATRYAVWFVALLALLLLPVVTLWHPTPAFTTLPPPVVAGTAAIARQATFDNSSWLIALWIAGVAVSLARLLRSHLRIKRILKAALPAPMFGPDVLTSQDVAYPIAAGFFAPMVILPANVGATLERRDLEAIVRHERAHIARHDILTNLAQRLLEACLFFNPWVYVIGRQLLKEREAACDDWAVNAMGEPDRYASCLAQLASGAHTAHTPLLTPSAMGSRRMLVGRIARLLDGKATQLKANTFVVGASALAFALLTVVLQTTTGQAAPTAVAVTTPTNCDHGATVVSPAAPAYPKDAPKVKTDVTVRVGVAASGSVTYVTVVKSSGVPAIDTATAQAARASTYKPAMSSCKAVAGYYLFHAEFKPDL
jgi:TonB family protein